LLTFFSFEEPLLSYPNIATPQPSEKHQTSEILDYPGNNIATPLPSVSEPDMHEKSRTIATPDRTEVDGVSSLIEQFDFIP
jgi:hypothetical protein